MDKMEWVIGLDRVVRRLELDTASGRAQIEFADGRTACADVTHPAPVGTTVIRTLSYRPADQALTVTTLRGEQVVIRLHEPDGPGDRPVVYLDQMHWSTLSRHLYGTGSVAAADREAADELIQRARAGRIVLPLSGGHMLETAAFHGARRQDLACTVLRLSGGWRMLHPVRVRKAEFAAVLTQGHAPARSEVFAVDGDGLFTVSDAVASAPDAQIGALVECLALVAANADVLLDPEAVDNVKPVGWAQYCASVAADPAFQALNRPARRKAAQAICLQDVAAEVWQAAASLARPPEPGQAIERLQAAVRRKVDAAPFFALYSDAMDERLSSFHTVWEPNDLIDMMFLSCAAAYADVVAAERTATNYLNASWRDRPGRCPVVRTLGEAVSRLDANADVTA